jgi:putative pyruvate formate lyase activating enzyme
MRCAFCQNGDISTDKDNGEETDPRSLATMAWTLRREGCHNVNWVGGEVVIHLHAIVDAIALLGRDFAPTWSSNGFAKPRPTDFSGSTKYLAMPTMTASSIRRCSGTATSS